jgi:hypothetical protein
LADHGVIVVADSLQLATDAVNTSGPMHLELH